MTETIEPGCNGVKYYRANRMITVEWHKTDPEGEFRKISSSLGYSQIERLNN